MATYTLGQAAYVNKGAYSASTTYAPLNTCLYDGGTWVALQSVTGVTPGSDSTKWLCITQGVKSATVTASGGSAIVTFTLTDGTQASATIPLATPADGSITVVKLASGFVLPVEKGGTGATSAAGALTALGAQKTIQVADVTLETANWSNKSQTVTISGMTINSKFLAAPADPASWAAAADAMLYPPTASANSLEFTCEETPTSVIEVQVYWW